MVHVENLEKTFNLPQIIDGDFTVEEVKDIVPMDSNSYPTVTTSAKLDDSDYIRKNLKELADSTKDALDLALQMQMDDPNFRNTEAVAKMADAVAKTLGNLIHLNKTEKDELYRSKPEDPKVVNNNLVITTTEDLIAKILSQAKQLKDK